MKSVLFILCLLINAPLFAQHITGEQVVERMHKTYSGKWFKTLTFVQTTEFYRNDTLTGKQEWYEAIKYPKSFRMEFGDPVNGNTALYRNDSLYRYRSRGLVFARKDPNDLLFVLGGLYFYPLAEAKSLFGKYGYDLSKGFEGTWKGKPVYIIGAAKEGETVNQLWVDKQNLVPLRLLQFEDGKKMESIFEGHMPQNGGWVETKISFYNNDALIQVEHYKQIKTNTILDDKLFDPVRLYAGHWYGDQKPKEGSAVIKNVSIISMTSDKITQGDVYIKDGLIEKIGQTGKLSAGYKVIDGTGKYLVPGLMDAHVHFFTEQGLDKKYIPDEAMVMLANGTTTARVMAGHPLYLDYRNKIRSNTAVGPELFVMSPQVVGKWPWGDEFKNYEIVDTPTKAFAAVKKFRDEGYDGVKYTMFIKPDVHEAVATAAKQLQIPITGHVGPDVRLPRALAAKQQVEHLDEYIEMLLQDGAPGSGNVVSGGSVWKKDLWPMLNYLDTNKLKTLAKQVKESGIYTTPTSEFLQRSFAVGMPDSYLDTLPDYRFMPPFLQDYWKKARDKFWTNPPVADLRAKFIDYRQRIVKGLYDEGAPLMAGSDAPDWFLVYGFALHRELERFVDAGLSPYAALQTATVNPATYLNILYRKGTIESGKEADLLLLDGNPLTDIRNTQRIAGVMSGGVYFDRKELDKQLNRIEGEWKTAVNVLEKK